MAQLVIGPLLRRVDAAIATIWMEIDRPSTVTVTAGEARSEAATFTVHGHHYAIVDVPIRGTVPYTVDLDGERVWPVEGQPPSVIRPVVRLDRVVFGSCRTSVPHDESHVLSHGVDVLRELGLRAMRSGTRPDLLVLLGDQIYADELTPEMKRFIASRRDGGPQEVVDFEEYAELYRQAWTDPPIRWLLSTVPSLMIFDDHDIRDDWNTSQAWREQMVHVPWWRQRIVAGLGSYFVYQHLGNLAPEDRAADPVLAALKAGDDGVVLDRFAAQADDEPDSVRWSYHQDFGGSRLIMLDSRASRMVEPGKRRMIGKSAWAWFEEHATGDVDHLLIGSSLPILLPSGIHHVETWSEAVCDGMWGRRAARWVERLRQFLDLEHWAAFRTSFEDLAGVLGDVAAGRRGRPPATILLLSGDVHYSYLASVGGRIHQIVCSPIRNPLSRVLRIANIIASFGVAGPLGRLLALLARVPRPPLHWKITKGPWFQNALAAIELTPDTATITWSTHNTDLGSVRLPPR